MNIQCSMIGNHKQWVYQRFKSENYRSELILDSKEFHDPDSSSSSSRSHIPHQSRIATSSRRKLSREYKSCEIHEKKWKILETFVPANLFDKILTNYAMIIEIWQHESRVQKKDRYEKGEDNTNALLSWESEREKSRDSGDCSLFAINNHAAGVRTCTQSGMTIPSYPSWDMHLGNFPDHTELQRWRVIQNRSMLDSEKSSSRNAVGQKKSKQPKQLTTSSRQNHFQWWSFSRLWWIGHDDGGSIEEVLR